jgi:hypothetical protein
MPTPEEIREYREWRAKIINGIWDAEANDVINWGPGVQMRDILPAIGAERLPTHFVSRIVNGLVDDHLVEGAMMVDEETYPTTVKLTSYGRSEVENWIDGGQPTQAIPVEPNVVINNTTNFHAPVTSSAFVIGSTGTTVNMQTAAGDSLPLLIEATRQLLTQWQGSEDERESVTSDIELLESHAESNAAPKGWIKAAVRRLLSWSGTAAAVGASSALSSEVQQLAGDLLQHL